MGARLYWREKMSGSRRNRISMIVLMPGAEGIIGTAGMPYEGFEGVTAVDGPGRNGGCAPASSGIGCGTMGCGGAYRGYPGNPRAVALTFTVGNGAAARPLLPPEMADAGACMLLFPGLYAER